MKRFTAVLTDGERESVLSFHSRFLSGSIMNRADLKAEMKVWDMDCEKWKICRIYPDERGKWPCR